MCDSYNLKRSGDIGFSGGVSNSMAQFGAPC